MPHASGKETRGKVLRCRYFVVPEDAPEDELFGVSVADEDPVLPLGELLDEPALPLGEALDEPPEAEPDGLELEDDGLLLEDDGLVLLDEPPDAEPELDGLLGVDAEPPALPDMPEDDELEPERFEAELLPCEASLPARSQPYRPPTASARGIRMNADFLSM